MAFCKTEVLEHVESNFTLTLQNFGMLFQKRHNLYYHEK